MEDVSTDPDLSLKIKRLVEERGWNQEDFARISQLNRHTVRQILHSGPKRRLRNATVSQCASNLDELLAIRGTHDGDDAAVEHATKLTFSSHWSLVISH